MEIQEIERLLEENKQKKANNKLYFTLIACSEPDAIEVTATKETKSVRVDTGLFAEPDVSKLLPYLEHMFVSFRRTPKA